MYCYSAVWFHLFPRKEDNSGWMYYEGAKHTKAKLLIHSHEKETSKNKGIMVTNNLCWGKLNAIIRASRVTDNIKAEKFVKPKIASAFHKVTSIGIVRIV